MPLHRLAFAAVFLILFHEGHPLCAQQSVRLEIKTLDNSEEVLNQFKFRKESIDSLSAIKVVNDLLNELRKNGYLLAHINEVKSQDSLLQAYVTIGSLFQWIALRPGNLNDGLWRKLNFKENRFRQKSFQIEELNKLQSNILVYAENNGFPFASLKYDSLEIIENGFAASLNVEFGPPITFDSVQVVNQGILRSKFAGAYLGIQLGDLYDQTLIDAIVPRLRRLPYLRLAKSPTLTFQNNEGSVTLELERRRVNTIDGIIGFLPNSSSNSGLLLTGQFDLELYNPFATGKYIGIHWRRLREETQTLGLEYDHPNLFGSALSLDSDFNFLKQDSTFNRRVLGLNLNLNLGLNAKLGVITSFTATDLIATSQYQGSNDLPDILDFRLRRYGLQYSYTTLDDAILPRSGVNLMLSGSVGNKVIRQNAELANELYESIDLQSLQYQFDLETDYYVSLGRKTSFYTSLNGGWLSNDNLFQNDTYRIGGLQSIRGFDEANFFATGFLYSNFEGRFYLDQSSYLLLFTDLGYVEERFVGQTSNEADLVLGLGTGISFATNNGVFNFVYALGTSNSVGPINFNQSKIHFGFTTRF